MKCTMIIIILILIISGTINTTFKRTSRLLLLQLHSHSHCSGAKCQEHFFRLWVAMVNGHDGPPLPSAGQSEAALEPETFSVTSGVTGNYCSSGGKPAGGADNRVGGWGRWGVGGACPFPPHLLCCQGRLQLYCS